PPQRARRPPRTPARPRTARPAAAASPRTAPDSGASSCGDLGDQLPYELLIGLSAERLLQRLPGRHGGVHRTLVPDLGGPHPRIQRLEALDRGAFGGAAVGVVADDRTARVTRRGDVREYPIVGAVLGQVVEVGEDLATVLDGLPHEVEQAARGLGVADDAVGPAEDLLLGV